MKNKPPNILLISADQWRHDCCGPKKPEFLRTPHLDRLAHRGITFNRAYSDTPICVPARCTVMSGRHAFNHGMMSNRQSSEVLGSKDTLPGRLRELNYQTIGIGKMHFEPHRARHGFDECLIYADYHKEMMGRGPGAVQNMRNGLGQCEMEPGMATVPEALTYTSWTAEKTLEFIRERRDPTRPFFAWTSFGKPHPPFDPPEPYYSMYRGPEIDMPEPVIGDWVTGDNAPPAYTRIMRRQCYDNFQPALIREIRAAYYGLVTQIDYNIGRILAALFDTREFDNTWIIFTADHGEYLCDHQGGGKGFFHEASAHVPMIVVPPRSQSDMGAHVGTSSDTLVCLADLLPTFVGLAGGVASDVDGLNMVDAATGKGPGREFLEGTAHDLPGEPNWYWAITDGRWKYIWYPEGPVEQLFDVETDPHDERNLAALPEHTGQLERLRTEMVRRHEARNSNAVSDGKMLTRPLITKGQTERELRSQMWPGLHTEYLGHDVMH